jgi:adenylate cyclase class 2
MNFEIEKKYRLDDKRAESLRQRLAEVGAEARGLEFEENTLYAGPNLGKENRVLRLRRVDGRGVLTFKERFDSPSAIKRQREDETRVDDPDALASILDALGYTPALIYEKRRATWRMSGVEVVIDELPFGLFAEIEGDEDSIREAERLLHLEDAGAVHETYPQLTLQHGLRNADLIEARFRTK